MENEKPKKGGLIKVYGPLEERKLEYLQRPPAIIHTKGGIKPYRCDYGVEQFQKMDQFNVDRQLYANDKLYKEMQKKGAELPPKWRLLLNMFHTKYPKGNGVFEVHWGIDEMCYYHTLYDDIRNWGSGGTGKSEVWGAIAHMELMADPVNTTVVMVSTSLEMLNDRMFGAAVKCYEYNGNQPGRMLNTKPQKIEYKVEGTKRSGIYCAAVEDGDSAEKVKKRLGVHNLRTFLFIDEENAVPVTAFNAWYNMKMTGVSKRRGCSNPDSWHNHAGELSEPSHFSRKEVIKLITEADMNDPVSIAFKCKGEGRGSKSIVVHSDARRNPNIMMDEGTNRLHFLPGRENVMQSLLGKTADTYSFFDYVQVLGCIPPEGVSRTVLSQANIDNRFAMEAVVPWKQFIGRTMCCDPAFQGQHKAVAIIIDYGICNVNGEDQIIISCGRPIYIPTDANKDLGEQLITRYCEIAEEYGVTSRDIAIDATSNQVVIAQGIETRIGAGVYKVSSADEIGLSETGRLNKAAKKKVEEHHELTVSLTDKRKCKLAYKDRPTELWMNIREFVMHGHIRDLPYKCAHQLTSREFEEGVSPVQIISKKNMPGKGSPDETDALSVGLIKLRERDLIHPGGNTIPEIIAKKEKQGKKSGRKSGRNKFSRNKLYGSSSGAKMKRKYYA